MRVLLVVPPFGGLDRPSLGVHLLQAVGRRAGHTVDVLYSNISFAKHIGEFAYLSITEWPTLDLLGERIMGLSEGSDIPDSLLKSFNSEASTSAKARGYEFWPLSVEFILSRVSDWLENLSVNVRSGAPYEVVGFSSTFEQTNGLRILARLFRELFPSTTLIAGGANCEGEMASAIADYIPELNFVFSGESETAFREFLSAGGTFSSGQIIESGPNSDLDELPQVEYDEFFCQLDQELPNSITRSANSIQLPYESSRGCWWGHKHHCTFCGLNGNGMGFREKSPQKVATEISQLANTHAVNRICMTDNIMPSSYFQTLLPILAERSPLLDIFYEQKSNITLEKAQSLKRSGINRIQPGIEAINDSLLRHMRKGTSAKQNISLLRYARSIGIGLAWNLLSGFPGEEEWWYSETADWLSKMGHLEPPNGICKVSIDRFSPHFENPSQFGITNIRPHESYASAFPNCSDLSKLSYHFVGDSDILPFEESAALQKIRQLVGDWRTAWHGSKTSESVKPALEVVAIGNDRYMLIDTRGLKGNPIIQEISVLQAQAALVWTRQISAEVQWGLDLGIVVMGRGSEGFIPLACSDSETLRRFESDGLINRPSYSSTTNLGNKTNTPVHIQLGISN